jgi:hypothetical protein
VPGRIECPAREDFDVVPVAGEMLGEVGKTLACGRDVRGVMLIDEQELGSRGAIHRRFTGRLMRT